MVIFWIFQRDPIRIFYESLYQQVPNSELAAIWYTIFPFEQFWIRYSYVGLLRFALLSGRQAVSIFFQLLIAFKKRNFECYDALKADICSCPNRLYVIYLVDTSILDHTFIWSHTYYGLE